MVNNLTDVFSKHLKLYTTSTVGEYKIVIYLFPENVCLCSRALLHEYFLPYLFFCRLTRKVMLSSVSQKSLQDSKHFGFDSYYYIGIRMPDYSY